MDRQAKAREGPPARVHGARSTLLLLLFFSGEVAWKGKAANAHISLKGSASQKATRVPGLQAVELGKARKEGRKLGAH